MAGMLWRFFDERNGVGAPIKRFTGNNYSYNSINIINALAVAYKAIQELNEKIEGGMSQ